MTYIVSQWEKTFNQGRMAAGGSQRSSAMHSWRQISGLLLGGADSGHPLIVGFSGCAGSVRAGDRGERLVSGASALPSRTSRPRPLVCAILTVRRHLSLFCLWRTPWVVSWSRLSIWKTSTTEVRSQSHAHSRRKPSCTKRNVTTGRLGLLLTTCWVASLKRKLSETHLFFLARRIFIVKKPQNLKSKMALVESNIRI